MIFESFESLAEAADRGELIFYQAHPVEIVAYDRELDLVLVEYEDGEFHEVSPKSLMCEQGDIIDAEIARVEAEAEEAALHWNLAAFLDGNNHPAALQAAREALGRCEPCRLGI